MASSPSPATALLVTAPVTAKVTCDILESNDDTGIEPILQESVVEVVVA
jgi:hypothetical protein